MGERLKAGLTMVAMLSLFAVVIDASDNYTVNYGTNQSITAHTECRKVTNASATGASVYVPTQTDAEWQSFYTNPPAGVTIGSCATEVVITGTQSNANLCTIAGNPTTPGEYVFVIQAGTIINSNSTAQPALATGTCWPAGSTVTIVNNGSIYGRGGDGGAGGNYTSSKPQNGAAGGSGGPAVGLSYPVTIDNTNGQIFGGGGGGGGGPASLVAGRARNGGSGGGGGQGSQNSAGGTRGSSSLSNGVLSNGTAGTVSAPGAGGAANGVGYGKGGNGGAWGTNAQAGGTGGPAGASPGVGGVGGPAIDTNGHAVTWLGGNDAARIKGAVSN